MKKRVYSYGTLMVLLIVSFSFDNCTNNKNNSFHFDITKNIYHEENDIKKISIDESNEPIFLNSLGSIDSVVVLDTTGIIGKIDKIQIVDNNIYIMDENKAKAVFCFSIKGQFKWRYKNVGRGKGKYVRLGDFQVRNGILYILDSYKSKIIKLNSSGQFLEEINTPKLPNFFAYKFFVDTNGDIIFYTLDFAKTNEFPYGIIVMDSTCKKILSCHFPQPAMPMIKRWVTPMSPMQFYKNENGFYFTKPMNDTIYTYSKGVIAKKYYVDFGKYKIPTSVRMKKDFNLDSLYKSKYKSDIERIAEDDSLISFLFTDGNNPAYCFVDKASLQSKSFPMIFFNINGYSQTLLSVGNANGATIAQINPLDIIRFTENLKRENSNLAAKQFDSKFRKNAPLLYNLRKQISPRSNQILVFINFSQKKIFNHE